MTKNKPDIPSRQESRKKRVQKIVQLLGLSGAGIGITAIAGFLVNGQYVAAVISAIVTAGITFLAIGGKFAKDVWERVLLTKFPRHGRCAFPLPLFPFPYSFS